MRDLFVLLVAVTATVFRLARPGGLRAVVAESVLLKHQLLIVNRSRRRAPNLRVLDRLIAGICSLWIKPTRFRRGSNRIQAAIDVNEFPSRAGAKKVLTPVFAQSTDPQARTKRTSRDVIRPWLK